MAELDTCVVMITFPNEAVAATLARALLEKRLAACVNLVASVRSLYEWQGEICDDRETLAIVKTTQARLSSLESFVRANHPYDCPELIALPISGGAGQYLDWVAKQVAD